MICAFFVQEAIARVVDEELNELLRQCSFYSLMLDESTDITTTQTLIIYIRFVDKGEVYNMPIFRAS